MGSKRIEVWMYTVEQMNESGCEVQRIDSFSLSSLIREYEFSFSKCTYFSMLQCTASCKMDQRLHIWYKISLQHSAFAFGLAQSPRITSLLTSAFLTIEKYDISFQNPVSPETFHLLQPACLVFIE